LFINIKDLINSKLEVLDSNGKSIFNQSLNSASNSINTSSFSNGMYLLKVTSDEGSTTSKIIKN